MSLRYVILGSAARLYTAQGDAFWVDLADLECVSGLAWQTQKHGHVYRRYRDGSAIRVEYLHRRLLNPPSDKVVDHIDGDGFNNRRSNLRICTHAENAANRGPEHRSSTGFVGVEKLKRGGFKARMRVEGRLVHLGVFSTAEEASAAYREARGVSEEFYRRGDLPADQRTGGTSRG